MVLLVSLEDKLKIQTGRASFGAGRQRLEWCSYKPRLPRTGGLCRTLSCRIQSLMRKQQSCIFIVNKCLARTRRQVIPMGPEHTSEH